MATLQNTLVEVRSPTSVGISNFVSKGRKTMTVYGLRDKKTKIVATLGPSSRDKETIRKMIRGGLNVARINFSHGDHATHGNAIDLVREVAAEEKTVVGILVDIQGPKIRLGKLAQPVPIQAGDRFTLTLDRQADGTNGRIQLPHPEFIQDIQPGTRLLYGDGELQFTVVERVGTDLICESLIDGLIEERKGIMAPNAKLTLSAITEKDSADIAFALTKEPDFMAMSFVRSAEDILQMRWLIQHLNYTKPISIIAKIEKHEALECIEAITDVADGIMVARGDLGLEIPPENVPFQQKRIIRISNERGKPVITATQMLNSMTKSPSPTRAEASDVYNAIVDGTDAVMLSNETASGDYPVQAVQMMTKIAVQSEARSWPIRPEINRLSSEKDAIADAISASAYQLSQALHPVAIVTSTITGYTARKVASERPSTPILCVTPNESTYRSMTLVWGVTPMMIPEFGTFDKMVQLIIQTSKGQGYLQDGDRIIIIAGMPFRLGGQTNLIKVHVVSSED